ncbi:hypothetical protein RCG24_09370 [Neobacillus sp. OS1-32]|nr:hypothetical protein [Neobacillus sp. OS1-32]WML32021.1 hypothetical protein RCG24_09370 [Neobacillus sp. OS1-32]
MTGYLEVNAIGKMGNAINTKLETVLPEAVTDMALAICEKLGQLKSV